MDATTKSNQPDPATVRSAARLIYESTPARLVDVAAQFKVTQRTIANWSAEDPAGPWRKINGPQITEDAHETADKLQTAIADIADEEDRQATLASLRVDAAVTERANIIARHRGELMAPRRMLYESIQKHDIELTRQAKLAIEAMDRLQLAERRAWNIVDAGEPPASGVTVIIERA